MEMDIMEVKDILKQLKAGLIAVRPEIKESDFGPDDKRLRNYKEFYFKKKNERKNFFDDPRDLKLGTGTCAIRSSAAFIYNIFGQDEICIDRVQYNKIEYEKKLTALANRNKAQLDGFLVSKDKTIIKFFETKLLEWSYGPKNLSKSYLSTNNYPEKNDCKQQFVDFFNKLHTSKPVIEKGEEKWKHKSKVYDAIQMSIHTLAIYNSLFEKDEIDYSETKVIELINLVWDYDCKRYKDEEEDAKDYINSLNEKFSPHFKKHGLEFIVKYISFSDFIKTVRFQNPERLNYLNNRYLLKEV